MRKDLTTGNVLKTVITTSWPMVLALLLQTAFNIVDAIYVGKLSAEAIAAVSLAFPLMFLIFAIAGGVGVGGTALISRYIGAKQPEKADNVAEHALVLGGVLGLIFTVIGLLFGKHILLFMGGKDLLALSLSYLNPLFTGTIFLVIFSLGINIFRGEGDTKTPMVYMFIATITNIILDPIFIFVFGWGVAGAASATVISNIVGCILVILGLTKGKSSIKIRPKNFKFDMKIIKDILKIGIPSSAAQVSMSVSSMVMLKIVASFGTYAIAAYGITSRLDSIAVLPALGLMMSLIPIVGQNIGAKKYERVTEAAFKTAAIAALFTGFVGLVFFIFPELFISLFNTNQYVLDYGALYLRTVCLFYAFIGINISMTGAFLGSGNAITSLFFTLLRVIILVIPISLLLAFTFNLGLWGVWLAVSITILISGTSSFIWFSTGRWKKQHEKLPAQTIESF